MIPNIMFSATQGLPLTQLYLEHGSHFRNVVKVCTDGMVRGSFDHKLHECDRGEAGVHCSPVSSPDLPGDAFKSEAHRFATHCHMQIEGEPV